MITHITIDGVRYRLEPEQKAFVFTAPLRLVHSLWLHCSASDYPDHDDVSVIERWHLAKGWSDVGYHWYIRKDGKIQPGRSLERVPAAQRGHNYGALAVCVGGLKDFTTEQFVSLRALVVGVQAAYSKPLRVRGHCEVSTKTCPVFDYRTMFDLCARGHLPGHCDCP